MNYPPWKTNTLKKISIHLVESVFTKLILLVFYNSLLTDINTGEVGTE